MRQTDTLTYHWCDRRTWESLDWSAREALAFKSCGCALAWPTWEAPVHCCHVGCQVLRGELPSIAVCNGMLRYEAENGWLRFYDRSSPRDRNTLARIFRHVRNQCRRSGDYDIWHHSWNVIVTAGVSA